MYAAVDSSSMSSVPSGSDRSACESDSYASSQARFAYASRPDSSGATAAMRATPAARAPRVKRTGASPYALSRMARTAAPALSLARRPASVGVRSRGLVKAFGSGRAARQVLRGVDLDVAPGELVAVVGRSGSGKSTLLHLLGALDRPDAGSIEIAGQRLDGRAEKALTELRRRHVGLVFQFFHL